MKISLITVCYNSAATIRDTINSVLSQTYENIEYIVVDGGSTDGTQEIIMNYELQIKSDFPNVVFKWISEKDNGLYDAMNKGIKMATGDVVGFLNSDDLFYDNCVVEKVMNAFAENPNADAVYADLFYVTHNDTGKIVRKWITGKQHPFCKGWHPAHPTFYVKKEIYNKAGLFNLDFRLAADFEIMLRFIEKYKISLYYLKESLVKMRLGGTTNKSIKNIINQNIECIKAFKKNQIWVNSFLYPIVRIIPKLKQYK